MKHIKIGIATYFFPPVINPRAFRVLELARYFARIGHEVTLFVPDWRHDYTSLEQENGFHVRKVEPGFWLNRYDRLAAKGYLPEDQSKSAESQKKTASAQADARPGKSSWLNEVKTFFVQTFYMGGFSFEYFRPLARAINDPATRYDLFISVALPMSPHLGTALAHRKNRSLAKVLVAEYGDPYSFNTEIRPPFFHRWLERWMLKSFDYITVPIQKAMPAFLPFKAADKIKVIPQGIDFSRIKTGTYKKNPVSTFIYAGNFYQDIRNPKELISFLLKKKAGFRFLIYTNTADLKNMSLIQDLIGEDPRFEVHPLIPREACIFEMSQADFLVNIENTTTAQQPSKLIDYYLAARPIFTYKPGNFDPDMFDPFLQGDFLHDIRDSIKIDAFSIEKVGEAFLQLLDEKRDLQLNQK